MFSDLVYPFGVLSGQSYKYQSIFFRFLARRTDAKFNKIILRRLFMSKYVPV